MKDIIDQIKNQYKGIDESDLTKLEKNILGIINSYNVPSSTDNTFMFNSIECSIDELELLCKHSGNTFTLETVKGLIDKIKLQQSEINALKLSK